MTDETTDAYYQDLAQAIEELESWPAWTRAGTGVDELIADQKRRLAERSAHAPDGG